MRNTNQEVQEATSGAGKGISRRKFLEICLAAGAGVVSSKFLVACGPTENPAIVEGEYNAPSDQTGGGTAEEPANPHDAEGQGPYVDESEQNADLPTPESFIDKIKKWGYDKVEYVGSADSNVSNVEIVYVYKCTRSNEEIVYSTVRIHNDGMEPSIEHDWNPGSLPSSYPR
jgi:hypothetical protein